MSGRGLGRPPVLVTAYRRPALLAGLLDRLRASEVTHLYVSIDAPRGASPSEAASVDACIALASRVDWAESLSIRVSESHLGCGAGMRAGLDWFFAHQDKGVILEDDTLPDPSFLAFCNVLLDRYEHDERVLAVSGCCLVPRDRLSAPDHPYRFSSVPHVWGWATWRRSWIACEPDLSDWRSLIDAASIWTRVQGSVAAALYWGAVFDAVRRGRLDTWDAGLVLAGFRSGQLTATANLNLVENRGFAVEATHPSRGAWTPPTAVPMVGELPDVPIEWDPRADSWTHAHHFQVRHHLAHALRDSDPYFAGFRREIQALAAARSPRS